MTSDEVTVNFRDAREVQDAVLQRCEELGISRTEFFKRESRRFLKTDTLNNPDALIRRAEELEEEAEDIDEIVEDLKTQIKLKENDARRKRERAAELRAQADDVTPYDDMLDDLAEYITESDKRHLFPSHGCIQSVAAEFGVNADDIINDLKDFTNLPDYRFRRKAGGSR